MHVVQSLIVVTKQVLEEYAERGVFRSFSQIASKRECDEFRFYWLFNLPFHLVHDRTRGELSFKKLLPGIAAGSPIELELRAFLDSLTAPDRVEHRRIDTSKLKVRISNLRGTVTLKFKVVGGDYEYAVRKAINAVNEVFLTFLNVRFPEYMIDKFKLSDE